MTTSAPHPSPIPVNIITGQLGAGKTTAIARLLAAKPPQEHWIIILNEFTDTGIDTLTLAAAAQGAYDLRTIPGGCLCCTGEEDFRRQLTALLAQPPEHWPARIVIEPSGIAHPGVVIEELRGFQRSGVLQLLSTIALVNAQSWAGPQSLSSLVVEQVDAADVVLLSKAELVQSQVHDSFMAWAQTLFPAKRYIGVCEQGVLPAQALCPPPAEHEFEIRLRPAIHSKGHSSSHDHAHAPDEVICDLAWIEQPVQAKVLHLLGRQACGWMIPASLLFDVSQLELMLADHSLWHEVERFKAIVRTGVDRWHLLQRWGQQYSIAPSTWRQDSRIELQLAEGVATEWQGWHTRWQQMCELCPVS